MTELNGNGPKKLSNISEQKNLMENKNVKLKASEVTPMRLSDLYDEMKRFANEPIITKKKSVESDNCDVSENQELLIIKEEDESQEREKENIGEEAAKSNLEELEKTEGQQNDNTVNKMPLHNLNPGKHQWKQTHTFNTPRNPIKPRVLGEARSAIMKEQTAQQKQEFRSRTMVKDMKNNFSNKQTKARSTSQDSCSKKLPFHAGDKFNNFTMPAGASCNTSEKKKPKVLCNINTKSSFATPVGKMLTSAPKEESFFNSSQEKTELTVTNLNTVIHKTEDKTIPLDLLNDSVVDKYDQGYEKLMVCGIEYDILGQLGKGGTSIVNDCFDRKKKVYRAVKIVNLQGEASCIQGYINEVKLLEKLQNCDRIIKLYNYEILKDKKLLYMVLEKGEKDLSSVLKELEQKKERLPIFMLVYYWMHMLYAVKQIHDNGIIHSDLKPSNFLVFSDRLKLIDFGIASAIQSDMTSVVKDIRIGTFNYISPEALRNNTGDMNNAQYKISYKSDVWSLGCMLYQMVYGKTPFHRFGNVFAKLSAIVDPSHTIEYPQTDWIPPKFIETIKSCLRYEIKERPSIKELIVQFENIYY